MLDRQGEAHQKNQIFLGVQEKKYQKQKIG